MTRHRARNGLTFVECVIALTILSFAMLAVTYSVVSGQQEFRHADDIARAARLAKDLSEEIVSKSYTEPAGAAVFGKEPGETTRQHFDDVDDYHNYAEAAGALADFTGAAYGSAEQVFGRSVTVTAGGQAVPALGVTVPGVTVTVRVRNTSGVQCEVTRFIAEP